MGRKVGSKDRVQRKKKMASAIEYNTNFVYKNLFGGDRGARQLAAVKANKLDYAKARSYYMDVSRAYAQDLDRNRDPNEGLARVNKKYQRYF